MIKDVTLPHVLERLQRLEQAVQSFGIPLDADTPTPAMIYLIRVDGEEVWRGSDLDAQYEAIQAQYPQAEISIGWETSPLVLV